MNRVLLNKEEITNFETDQDTIEFAELLLANKSEFTYDDDNDTLSIELDGLGFINVDLSDLDEDGKLNIF